MIPKEERRWIIGVTILLLGITSIPYVIGYFRQGTDWHFTGFLFGVEDGNSYIAKMLSGSYGSWLFRSPYTSMPQNGVLAFLPYILLGKLAYPPEIHDQLVALFQVFRWIGGGLLIWAVYSFVALYIDEIRLKRIATLIILLGGGLGWLGWLLVPGQWSGRLPLEIYSPEAFGFLSLLGLPHLSAARAFLLFGLLFFLKSDELSGWQRNAIIGGICWVIVGFFQPLTIVVGYGILGCYLVILFLVNKIERWKTVTPLIKKAALMGAIASPWVLYNVFFFSADPYLQIWYKQNIIDSPPLAHYLWSYAAFLVAAVPGVLWLVRQKSNHGLLLLAWVICAATLAYFPYNLQRRFIDGIWIALILLVFQGIPLISQKPGKFFYHLLLGLTFVAPILVLLIVSQGVWGKSRPVYRPASEIALFNEIARQAKPGDTVLASYDTANALPAWAPVFVLAGHGPESANLKSVMPDIDAFYSDMSKENMQSKFIRKNSVDFILFGPLEKKAGTREGGQNRPSEKLYDQDGYQLYRVNNTDDNE